LYVAWLGNFITRVNFVSDQGRFFVMLLVVVTKFTDIGAYLTGSTIGRHKMIPRISPKKTWEGTIGGIVFAVGGSVMCLYWPPKLSAGMQAAGMNLTHALVLGLLLAVLSLSTAGMLSAQQPPGGPKPPVPPTPPDVEAEAFGPVVVTGEPQVQVFGGGPGMPMKPATYLGLNAHEVSPEVHQQIDL